MWNNFFSLSLKLDLFIYFTLVTHVVIAITLFLTNVGKESLQLTMDIVKTPKTPRTPTVRRNLFMEFENTELPVCEPPEVGLEFTTPVRPKAENVPDIDEQRKG